MATLVQQARLTKREELIARNAEEIYKEAKKLYWELLPTLDSLLKQPYRDSGQVRLPLETGWIDANIGPVDTWKESMHAASDEFARWFKEMFYVDVDVYIELTGDPNGDYTGAFDVVITRKVAKRKRRFLRR